jgi:hypothetical protein
MRQEKRGSRPKGKIKRAINKGLYFLYIRFNKLWMIKRKKVKKEKKK